MKKLLLLLLMGILPQLIYAQTAKAVLGYSPDAESINVCTLYFIYDSNTYNSGKTKTITIKEGVTETVKIRINQITGFLKGYSWHDGDNPQEEERSPWTQKIGDNTPRRDMIYRVVFTESFKKCKSQSYQNWFYECRNLTKVEGGEYLNTSACADFGGMFHICTNLVSVEGAKRWVTSAAHNLHVMFSACLALKEIDVSEWDTSGIKKTNAYGDMDMRYVFRNCSSLTSEGDYAFDVSTKTVTRDDGTTYTAWDVSNVNSMVGLFFGCTGLTSLDLSGWTPKSVITTSEMFQNCSGLERLSFPDDFETPEVQRMNNMFNGCTNLKSITFGKNFTMNKVSPANSASMFANCPKLRYIDFFNSTYDYTSATDRENPLNISKVSRTSNTFKGVPSTTVIYMPVRYDAPFGDWSTGQYAKNLTNVVYTDTLMIPTKIDPRPLPFGTEDYRIAYRSRCVEYFSEDKTDIELPRNFTTLKADYTRAMTNEYGSAILPYAFTYNAEGCVRPYMQNKEYEDMMHFKDVETVPAHTPFAFKKLATKSDDMVHFEQSGETIEKTAGFVNPLMNASIETKKYDDYSLTVNATRSTNADESTWDPETHKWTNSTTEKGSPYVDDGTDSKNTNINQNSNLSGWITRGYYVTEIFNNTVTIGNEPYYMYYIGTKDGEDQLLRADGKTRAYPPRVNFLKKKSSSNGAKSYNLDFGMGDDNIGTAIETAEREKTIREAKAIYDMQGRKIAALQKGINIVRMTDGTVKKVIIK